MTQVTLPSGSKLGVYQPKHASPTFSVKKAKKAAPRKPAKKQAGKKNSVKAKKRK